MAKKNLTTRLSSTAGTLKKSAREAKKSIVPADVHGPSPNAATNLAIADIALRGGSVLARRAVQRAFLGASYSSKKSKKILMGRSISERLFHTALARVALTSVPGAIIVGGAFVAKTLYDRSKAGEAALEGKIALEEMAEEGSEAEQ